MKFNRKFKSLHAFILFSLCLICGCALNSANRSGTIANPFGPAGSDSYMPTANIIQWKGTLVEHPSTPELNWAYHNSTDNKAYIYDGSVWKVMMNVPFGAAPTQYSAGAAAAARGVLVGKGWIITDGGEAP